MNLEIDREKTKAALKALIETNKDGRFGFYNYQLRSVKLKGVFSHYLLDGPTIHVALDENLEPLADFYGPVDLIDQILNKPWNTIDFNGLSNDSKYASIDAKKRSQYVDVHLNQLLEWSVEPVITGPKNLQDSETSLQVEKVSNGVRASLLLEKYVVNFKDLLEDRFFNVKSLPIEVSLDVSLIISSRLTALIKQVNWEKFAAISSSMIGEDGFNIINQLEAQLISKLKNVNILEQDNAAKQIIVDFLETKRKAILELLERRFLLQHNFGFLAPLIIKKFADAQADLNVCVDGLIKSADEYPLPRTQEYFDHQEIQLQKTIYAALQLEIQKKGLVALDKKRLTMIKKFLLNTVKQRGWKEQQILEAAKVILWKVFSFPGSKWPKKEQSKLSRLMEEAVDSLGNKLF